MPLDHYISQVHLRRFYAASLDNKKMYAFRKSDGRQFICGSSDVCRVSDGSTTPYLPEPRLVEDFLKYIEPNYNTACQALTEDKIKPNAVFVCAGFAAFVMCCSPAGIRLSSAPLEEALKVEAAILDRVGHLPKAPPELDGKQLSELLADGTIAFIIDQKYPQAIGIGGALDRTFKYGNFHWDILLNEHADTPFFSSDFPVGVEASGDFRVVNRIVVLAPHLAIRICPRLELADKKLEPTFEHFSYTRRNLSRSQVVDINRIIVRSAEDLVLSSVNEDWVLPFMLRNSQFRVESETTNIAHGTGFLSVTRTILREHRD